MSKKNIDVFYHNHQVGTLAEMADKRIAFQYSESWIKEGFSISPLSLPLKRDVFIPKDNSIERFGGLFGVFADSLPDSWGKLLLDRHLTSLGIENGNITTIERLAYVGASGMGALEYHPSKETDFDIKSVGLNYDEIAEECSKILSSKESDQLDFLYKLGGSSGGTRPKILLKEGEKEWIIKFPAKTDPGVSGKREYDYSLCAKRCGIIMSGTDIVESSVCDGYFKTERFDRERGNKIFTITFAGLLEADYNTPSCDYSTYFKLVRFLTKDNGSDKEQMFKTMCFNVLAHNRDDHTKNFSFMHTQEKGWHLAPAYDITYSNTYFGEQTTSVNGKGKDIAEKDLIKVGMDADIPEKKCREYLSTIKDEIKTLEKYIKHPAHTHRKNIPTKDRLQELSAKPFKSPKKNAT